jgi:hypothetical protein
MNKAKRGNLGVYFCVAASVYAATLTGCSEPPQEPTPQKPAVSAQEELPIPATRVAPDALDILDVPQPTNEGTGGGFTLDDTPRETDTPKNAVNLVTPVVSAASNVMALEEPEGNEDYKVPTPDVAELALQMDYAMNQIATFMLDRDKVLDTISRLNELEENDKNLKLELIQAENSINVLLARVRESEEKMAQYEQQGYIPTQDEPLTIQEDFRLVGGVRYPMSPEVAQKFMKSIQALVPNEIEVTGKGKSSLTKAYKSLQAETTQVNFLTQFMDLAADGVNVHFVIGAPNPEKRPVWLEVYGGGKVTLCHPELDLKIFSNMTDRSDLPTIFRAAAFGITFDNGLLQLYELRQP